MLFEVIISDGLSVVRYRPVACSPGYLVGTDGSVWSCRRGDWKRLRPRTTTGRKARQPLKGRYLFVTLRTQDGRSRNCLVHLLVLEAFAGPRPAGMEGCHGDGNPANNRLDNLRWDTHGGNREDMRRHGTLRQGSRSPHAKLCEADVPTIFRLRRMGWTLRRIARWFGVSQTTISRVLRREKWKHVPLRPRKDP